MEDYREQRKKQSTYSNVTGIVVTVVLHGAVIAFGSFSGLKYLDPPPEEKSLLIEFEEVTEQDPIKVRTGAQPRTPEPDPTQHINLVKLAEAQYEGNKANESPEATMGPDGDVDVYEPEREKEINRRALFHSADNKTDKDTMAPQTSYKPTDKLSEGHAAGNTTTGKTTGTPNAHLTGRTVGTLPSPTYTSQIEGTVIVNIWVNQYGEVEKALIADETNVSDAKILQAALNAAKKAHFSMKADAPVLQQGTITYNFKLK